MSEPMLHSGQARLPAEVLRRAWAYVALLEGLVAPHNRSTTRLVDEAGKDVEAVVFDDRRPTRWR